MEDPRLTRAQRRPASSNIGEQGTILSEGVTENVVPPNSEKDLAFFNSLSTKIFELGTGDFNAAIFYND